MAPTVPRAGAGPPRKRRFPLWAKIAIPVVLIIVTAAAAGGSKKKDSPVATSNTTVATGQTATPAKPSAGTAAPAASITVPGTATSTSGQVSAAVLGGTREAWRAKLGVPDASRSSGNTDTFGKCPSPGPSAGNFQFQVTYTGSGRALAITRQTCGNVSNSANFTEAASYLPPDQTRYGNVTHENPGEDDYTLTSASLPSGSVDCASKKPGGITLAVDGTGWTALTCSP